jgi:hypothetical protein
MLFGFIISEDILVLLFSKQIYYKNGNTILIKLDPFKTLLCTVSGRNGTWSWRRESFIKIDIILC